MRSLTIVAFAALVPCALRVARTGGRALGGA